VVAYTALGLIYRLKDNCNIQILNFQMTTGETVIMEKFHVSSHLKNNENVRKVKQACYRHLKSIIESWSSVYDTAEIRRHNDLFIYLFMGYLMTLLVVQKRRIIE
jgi:hypothetical protein